MPLEHCQRYQRGLMVTSKPYESASHGVYVFAWLSPPAWREPTHLFQYLLISMVNYDVRRIAASVQAYTAAGLAPASHIAR